MTLVVKVDGVELPDDSLLITGTNGSLPGGVQGLPTAAWYGESLTGGLGIVDEAGDLDLQGWHTLTVNETACSKPRIWSGWIIGRRITRGPFRSGASRIWQVDCLDMNQLFSLMVFRAGSARRPDENDLVRMDYLINSTPMSFTPLHDNGRWNTTDNPTPFNEADYVKQYPIHMLNSVAGISGKNGYAYWDHDAEEISGHYDLVGVGPDATIAISNDMADTDSTTFYPFVDAELAVSPEVLVTGILFGYRGAYVYDIRQATIDSLSPTEFSPVEFQRDEVYDTDRVGKQATAETLLDQMLVDRAQERQNITVAIRVPASQVNHAEAGEIIAVKFTHLPGYEDFVELPIIRRNVVPTPGRVDMYDCYYELHNLAAAVGPGGGSGGDFPHVPPGEHWWSGSGSSEGDDGYANLVGDSPLFVPGTYTYYLHVQNARTYAANFRTMNAANTGGFMLSAQSTGCNTCEYTWTGQFFIDALGVVTDDGGQFQSTGNFNINGGFTETWHMQAKAAASHHEEDRIATYDFYIDLVSGGGDEPPGPDSGSPVGPEIPYPTPNGTNMVFNTNYPYADGSLRVYVDNLNQTAAVTESDPATGEFTLAFAPRPDEVLTVWYQGR